MNTRLVIPAEMTDVEVETRFGVLNEIGFMRAASAKHQFYLLVTKAYQDLSLPIDETVRGYLVTMLERFIGRAGLLDDLAAFDFYRFVLGSVRVDALCAQDAADISLQYVAFFPERSRYRHEPRSIEFVANMGVSLYRGLARETGSKNDWFSEAYRSMARSFGRSVMLLRAVCPEFALRREISRERFQNEAKRVPSFSEAMELAPALRNFNGMYLQRPEDLRGIITN